VIHLDRMTAAGSTAQEIQQPFTVTNAVVTLPEEVSKITLADWHDSAAEYIRSELFNKKQFADDEELMMGGRIQELVCVNIHICGAERARLYWDEKGGKERVRRSFRRKRQAAQNAMKLAFAGTYKMKEVCIVFVL
jgi:hypothetical protein